MNNYNFTTTSSVIYSVFPHTCKHIALVYSPIAELDARRKQKEFELAQQCEHAPSSGHQGEPLYDEVTLTGKQFLLQECPAYAPLPPPRS